MAFKVDADKIKRWREERHWSQEHLADLAGLGLRTVQRIEKGEGASKESLMALAAAFDVEAIALAADPDVTASEIIFRKNDKVRRTARLLFKMHLAAFVLGAIVFMAIGMSVGNFLYMSLPLIWWTVGLASHGLTVVMVELITRFQDQ